MNEKWKRPRLRATLIARDDQGRILTLQHVRPQGRFGVLPGGGVDYGETVEDALVREMHEELNVKCVVDRLVAVGELFLPGRHVVDLFLTGTVDRHGSFSLLVSEGISKAEWLTLDEIRRMYFLPPEVIPVLEHLDDLKSDEIVYLGKYKIHDRKLPDPHRD